MQRNSRIKVSSLFIDLLRLASVLKSGIDTRFAMPGVSSDYARDLAREQAETRENLRFFSWCGRLPCLIDLESVGNTSISPQLAQHRHSFVNTMKSFYRLFMDKMASTRKNRCSFRCCVHRVVDSPK